MPIDPAYQEELEKQVERINNPSDAAPIEPEKEHPVLKKMLNRAKDDSVVVVLSGGLKIRLRPLKAHDYFEAADQASSVNSRDDSTQMNRAYEIVIRAITHIDDIPIEEIADVRISGKDFDAKIRARRTAISRMRAYYHEAFTAEDVMALSTKYGEAATAQEQATTAINKSSKKKSETR